MDEKDTAAAALARLEDALVNEFRAYQALVSIARQERLELLGWHTHNDGVPHLNRGYAHSHQVLVQEVPDVLQVWKLRHRDIIDECPVLEGGEGD